jgi:hypothetical protein
MRWQTTVVLAVLLLALGAFYYVYEMRLGPEREKAAGEKGRVFTVDTKDVTEVEIRRPDQTIRLAREGDGWQVTEPVKARGDRGAIDELVTTVVMAKMDREIAGTPASLGEFGLDKPAAEVTLTVKDGKRVGLTLGAKSPTGVWVYAQARDKPAVIVVGDNVLRDATRPLADFRDKTVLTFERGNVTALEIVTRDETLAVEQAEGAWKLTRPSALPADAETIGEFMEKLQSARVKEFVVESPRSLEPYGLERPLRLTIHTGKDKDRAARGLLMGRVDREKKGVYAKRPGEPSVLLLPEEVWTSLPKNVAALRNKVVVDVARDKVTRIDLESPKGTVTLVREKDQWRITAPQALPADQVEAGALLTRLRDLRAQAFLSDDGAAVGRYLARPQVKVTVTEDGAPAPKTVVLAPSPERRGGDPSAYAAVVGAGPVVLVDAKALDGLARSVTDLRDHALLSGLDPKEIKRVRIKSGGEAAVVERSGETDWRLVEPTRAAARPGKVDDLLYMLRALKWKDIVAPGGEDAARYGLDTPSFEVTLLRADGTEIATVLVGKRDGDRVYLKTRAAPAIYAAEARQLGELPKVPDDLKS